MNKKIYLLLAVIAVSLTSCKDEYKNLKDGLYAQIVTPKGKILIQLDYKKAPITVANFVTLAEGKNPFVMEDLKGRPFYDGIVFHRVEKGFVCQGGDPLGNGNGDPGYTFRDEITSLKHDKAGTVAMANSGPNTNGCQFYITLAPTPKLDGAYNVFGYVVEGMKVVNSISINDEMTEVKIIRKGEDVKKFDAVKVFTDYFKTNKSVKDKKADYFKDLKKTAVKIPTGVACKIITESAGGEVPKDGQTVYLEYSGFLEDGTLFVTSDPNVAKAFGIFNEQRAMQHGYSPLPYTIGASKMIPGFTQGLSGLKVGEKAVIFIPSQLGYGEQGAGNVVPPNANLIFEVEVKNKI